MTPKGEVGGYTEDVARLLSYSRIALLALLCATHAYSQALSANAQQQIRALIAEKESRTPAQQKIDSQLHYAGLLLQGAPIAAGVDTLQVDNGATTDAQGFFTVDITASVSSALLDSIRAQGGQIINSFAQFDAIRARIPASTIEVVAALPAVRSIRPAEFPVVNSSRQAGDKLSKPQRMRAARAQIEQAFPALAKRGLLARLGLGFSLIDTTGDQAHQANLVRSFGFNGTGVKIGILSDGIDPLATMQAGGDLPAVTVLPGQAGSGAEGTAMLQIVYNLAPGAQLYFATGGPSQAQFATNILNLRAAGCDIIVDDITYFAEGVFQDGIAAQAVNSVVASGALYFSSAGNEGRLDAGTSGTWEGDFVDSGVVLSGGAVHDFGGGLTHNLITQDAQASGGFWLKWSDPQGASSNDYDLYMLDSTLTTVIAASTNTQNGSQNPYEFIGCLTGPNCGRVGNQLVVVRKSGAATRALNLGSWRARFAVATTGCTFGHNAGANTISVAAVDVHTAGGGAFTGGSANPVETYSCDGPRRIFYNPSGSPITPGNLLFSTNGGTVLPKPDLAAADCTPTNTPGFGNPFCGTSAAAPHAAAIAALVKSARLTLTAPQIRAALNASALDIGTAGVDIDSGLGIVMAPGAVQSLSTPITINSIPAGLTFSISGIACPVGTYTTPTTLNWSLAASCSVSFASPQSFGGSHYTFASWIDGPTTNPRIIITPTVPAVYTALPVAAPGITESFGDPAIALNATTTLQFTLTNPNTTAGLSGVGFVDNLPPGLTAAGPVTAAGCPAAGLTFTSNNVTVSGITLAPLSSCTYSLIVTGSNAGVWNNLTMNVVSTEGGSGGPGSASIIVVAPPQISKAFGPVAIPVGYGTPLTFSIQNPNGAVPLTGLGFTDSLPAGLSVAVPGNVTGSCGGGAITAVAGTGVISLAGASLSAGSSCTFKVLVTGTAEGNLTNTTSTITATGAGVAVTGSPATASIFVGAASLANYATNLSSGESYINISNSGSSGLPVVNPGSGGAEGNTCVNVYAFSTDEQLVACCSCLVTPNGLVNLGVTRDLTTYTATGSSPTSVVVRLLTSLAGTGGTGTSCNNSAATITAAQLAGSTLAWGTTLYPSPGGNFAITERPFSPGVLSTQELASITARCTGIVNTGSGYGICASCRQGGLGAGRQ